MCGGVAFVTMEAQKVKEGEGEERRIEPLPKAEGRNGGGGGRWWWAVVVKEEAKAARQSWRR